MYLILHLFDFSNLLFFAVNVWVSQVVLVVKNSPADPGGIRDAGWISGLGSSLEKEMAIHSSILAWKIPQTEEPGGL